MKLVTIRSPAKDHVQEPHPNVAASNGELHWTALGSGRSTAKLLACIPDQADLVLLRANVWESVTRFLQWYVPSVL